MLPETSARYPVADGPSGRVLLWRFGALHRLSFIRTRLDIIFNTRAAALATQLMDEVHYNYTGSVFRTQAADTQCGQVWYTGDSLAKLQPPACYQRYGPLHRFRRRLCPLHTVTHLMDEALCVLTVRIPGWSSHTARLCALRTHAACTQMLLILSVMLLIFYDMLLIFP